MSSEWKRLRQKANIQSGRRTEHAVATALLLVCDRKEQRKINSRALTIVSAIVGLRVEVISNSKRSTSRVGHSQPPMGTGPRA